MAVCFTTTRPSCGAAMFAAIVWALASGSTATAAIEPGANGIYKPTHVSGSVRFGGETLKLPLGPLKNALLRKGLVLVWSDQIPIRHSKWAEVLEEFRFLGIRGKASVNGPPAILFKPQGDGYLGKAPRPLLIKLRGKYKFLPVTVTMNTSLETRVTGDILTMRSPLKITVLGISAKGSIQMTAKRQPLPR